MLRWKKTSSGCKPFYSLGFFVTFIRCIRNVPTLGHLKTSIVTFAESVNQDKTTKTCAPVLYSDSPKLSLYKSIKVTVI